MRLKHIFISEYKNLKDFTLTLEGNDFIDFFVGKNGSGKSNLLEALIVIFKHLYEQSSHDFDFKIAYEIDDKRHEIEWRDNLFYLNGNEKGQKSFTTIPLPENVLIYYSGHNDTITKIVRRYETEFRDRIKGANPDEARHFIGIGTEYKSLLLSTLLLQPDENIAKQFIKQKLTISAESPTVNLVLKRPKFADGRFKELTKIHETVITAIDHFDPRTHFWGADGITRDFLENIVNCIKGASAHQNIYNSDDDQYLIPVDVALFQEKFKDTEITEQFRLLDNLKTLGMLASVEVALTIHGNQPATLNHFSDGQFQSVYIYAVTELFKDKECITLLDEPDSFLHPEWQFELLKQISDITSEAKKSNHILMTSHSAATLCNIEQTQLAQLKLANDRIECVAIEKREVINDLSNSFIQYSEDESKLLIDNVIRTSQRPILFVEGPSDVNILNTAYEKLYPGQSLPILIQDAFDRGFIRTLLARGEIHQSYPQKLFFALFDFDDAYEDWRDLGGSHQVTDIGLGLCRKLNDKNAFTFLLPIPDNDTRAQVWDNDNPIEKIVPNPHFCIEHEFLGVEGLQDWFKINPKSGHIIFKGDKHKVKFSKEIVPNLPAENFEIFRPMFEFIKDRVQEHLELAEAS